MAILRVKDEQGNIIEIPAIKGDTPVKGVDYWTEVDKDDIREYVNEQISGSGSSHTHDNKAVLDGITADKLTAWDGKANAGILTGVDINTITAPGIYDVSDATLAGLPTLPTGVSPVYGSTMIVAPEYKGYQSKYLIIGGDNGSATALIYFSETYTDPSDSSVIVELPWTLMFNSNAVNELKEYVNQQLGVIENGTY